ncbi:MAG: ABC transporter substrate-binding protein [Minisyncoccia bacterium]
MSNLIKKIFFILDQREKKILILALVVCVSTLLSGLVYFVNAHSKVVPIRGGEYFQGEVGQPIIVNPVLANNQVDLDISRLVYLPLNQLIDDYQIKNGGKTYIFSLKENLTWNDGTPLTSDDVIFTLRLIQNPDVHSPLYSAWQGINIKRISAIRFEFSLPSPYFLFVDKVKQLEIIPEHIFGNIPPLNIQLSKYSLEPRGNGPYRFYSLKKENNGFITEYKLVVDENYSGPKPYIKYFTFKFYDNNNDLLNAFYNKNINGFGLLTPLNFDYNNYKNSNIFVINFPRYYALFLNPNSNSILKNQDIRTALNESIDKLKLVDYIFKDSVFDNYVFAINDPLMQPLTNINNIYNPQDAANKFNKNIKSTTTINMVVPAIDFLIKTANFIKTSVETISNGKIIINVNVINPQDALDSYIKNRLYDTLLFGNISEYPNDLFTFWHSSQRFYPGLNLSLYNNSKVDKLIESLRQSSDLNKQELQSIDNLITKDVPAIFLYSMPFIYISDNHLNGFNVSSVNNISDIFYDAVNWYILKAKILQ